MSGKEMRYESDAVLPTETIRSWVFVRHYWKAKTFLSASPTLLLPMDHVDLILCPPDTFEYGDGENKIVPESFHFHGVRRKSISVKALKETQVWGVSFRPWGFQPILKISMKGFTDEISLLKDYHPTFKSTISSLKRYKFIKVHLHLLISL